MTALGTIVRNPLIDFLGELIGHSRKIDCFESETGIHGQSWVIGQHLHLLSVLATEPGTGQFRRFMEACKAEYSTISVWHIMNPDLRVMLRRYGFKVARQTEPDGEVLLGMRWKRDHQPD